MARDLEQEKKAILFPTWFVFGRQKAQRGVAMEKRGRKSVGEQPVHHPEGGK